jgi:p-hydroxybenzoate 3-monooxygenase
VLGRIRAGVLESGTVELLERLGAAQRLHAEGLPHDGFELSFGEHMHHIDLYALTGKRVMVYGQTEVTRDLMDARAAAGLQTFYESQGVIRIPLNSPPSSPPAREPDESTRSRTGWRVGRG